MIATDLDNTKSSAPIYAVRIVVTMMTIHVALIRSWREGQVTLTISPLTSLKKTGIFANTLNTLAMTTKIWQERQESNLQFRFWRPVVYH